MASEQFSLCWDNFHVNMSTGMHSLLEKEDLVDVTLAIEGQYLKAHKMVLSVCSPYFRKLFSANPCKHPIFFMKDVTFEVMNDLLTFMYQGEVQVNQENLATFIKTAEALQIKGLTGENREVDDALKEVNSLKRPPPFPDEPKGRLTRSKPHSPPMKKTKIHSPPDTQDSFAEPPITSDTIQLKVEPSDTIEDSESYGWPEDSYLNESENLPDDSQVDEPEECHMMEEEPKAGTSLEGAIPNQVMCACVAPSGGRPSISNTPLRLQAQNWGHFPENIPPTDSKQHPTKRCRVCYHHNIRKETTWQCKQCKVPLHLPSCFEKFHTDRNY